ncbi:MAG: hypothetical protein RIE74_09395 [Pseudomonadales bacterium]
MTTRTVRGRRPHRLAAFTAAAALALSAASAAAAKAPAALVTLHTEVHQAGKPFPRFVVDAAWPDVPADLILGQVSGVSVDADDVVWLVNRPGSLDATETGPLQNPPIADCCRPAPPVVRFAQDGTYLGGWGGPDTGLCWTASISGPPVSTVSTSTPTARSGSAATATTITWC